MNQLDQNLEVSYQSPEIPEGEILKTTVHRDSNEDYFWLWEENIVRTQEGIVKHLRILLPRTSIDSSLGKSRVWV